MRTQKPPGALYWYIFIPEKLVKDGVVLELHNGEIEHFSSPEVYVVDISHLKEGLGHTPSAILSGFWLCKNRSHDQSFAEIGIYSARERAPKIGLSEPDPALTAQYFVKYAQNAYQRLQCPAP